MIAAHAARSTVPDVRGLDHGEAVSAQELRQGCLVVPTRMSLVDPRSPADPVDETRDREGIRSREHQETAVAEVVAGRVEEGAGVREMLDHLAGPDDVEGSGQIHRLGVGDDDREAAQRSRVLRASGRARRQRPRTRPMRPERASSRVGRPPTRRPRRARSGRRSGEQRERNGPRASPISSLSAAAGASRSPFPAYDTTAPSRPERRRDVRRAHRPHRRDCMFGRRECRRVDADLGAVQARRDDTWTARPDGRSRRRFRRPERGAPTQPLAPRDRARAP